MKRAIITGAAGFLGRHVARHLKAQGWRVLGIGYGEFASEEARKWGLDRWISGEVNVENLTTLIKAEGEPDLVFHAAGGASVKVSWDDPHADFCCTVSTTAAVIETLRKYARDAVLVYPSSAAIYGNGWSTPIPESAPACPVSPYGVHKSLAEQLCLAARTHYGIRCGIIRFFSLYGPELHKQVLWDMLRQAARRPETIVLGGNGKEVRDFLNAEDAAHLVALVGERVREWDEPIVVNGGNGRPVRIEEVAEALVQAAGFTMPVTFSGEVRPGDPQYLQADMALAERLGFAPRWQLADGLRNYARWALPVIEGGAKFAEWDRAHHSTVG